MIVFTPFLLLIFDSISDYLLGMSCIFLFMRAYSAYLHKAALNLNTISYIFYLPELITGPFRPYSKWSRLNFSKPYIKFRFNRAINAMIVLLFSGLILSRIYPSLESALLRSLLVYILLYIQFKFFTDLVNEISCSFELVRIENFNKPWLALSITDFWARWHMSLGDFVKTHFNQPLTILLSKKGFEPKNAYYLSIILSFIFIGLWHNYSISYLYFGLYFGSLVCAERFLSKTKMAKYLETKIFIRILYTQIFHFFGFHFVSEIVYAVLIRS